MDFVITCMGTVTLPSLPALLRVNCDLLFLVLPAVHQGIGTQDIHLFQEGAA